MGNLALAAVIRRLGPGRALARDLRAELEPAFGHDLGSVRIHDDTAAQRSATDANAVAFTHGEHIVLDSRLRDVLERVNGRSLLAHELAHVIQQRQGAGRDPSPAPTGPGEAEAEAAATAIAGGGAAPALAGTAVGLARAVAQDPAGLNDAELQAEHDATQSWLLDHKAGDPGYQDALDYFQRLEQEVSGRSAVSPAPASPASSTPAAATSSSSQSASYQALGDEELSELARQGDTDAAAEIFARARSSPGYQPPAPGNETLGPEVAPDFIGPERPPYVSGQTPLREGDIDAYRAFNTEARRGDLLEGHEALQNARLEVTGRAPARGTGPVSRGNPSLALSRPVHTQVNTGQQRAGLRSARLAAMSDEEVIEANMQVLDEAGVERSQIEMLRREALRHAAANPPPGGTAGTTSTTGGATPNEPNFTPANPQTTAAGEQNFTPANPEPLASFAEPNSTPAPAPEPLASFAEPNSTPAAAPEPLASFAEPNSTPALAPEPLASFAEPNSTPAPAPEPLASFAEPNSTPAPAPEPLSTPAPAPEPFATPGEPNFTPEPPELNYTPAEPLMSEGAGLASAAEGALFGLNVLAGGYGAYRDYEQGDPVGTALNLSTIGPQGIVTGPLTGTYEGIKAGGQLMKMEVDCSEIGMAYEMGRAGAGPPISADDMRLQRCWSLLAPQIQRDVDEDVFGGL